MRWKAGNPVRLSDPVLGVHEYGERKPGTVDEPSDHIVRLPDADEHNRECGSRRGRHEFLLNCGDVWQLCAARWAPSCPDIDPHRSTDKTAQADNASVEVGHSDIWCRRTGVDGLSTSTRKGNWDRRVDFVYT